MKPHSIQSPDLGPVIYIVTYIRCRLISVIPLALLGCCSRLLSTLKYNS
ncbi:hypothetical protein HanPSC8_Chr11g0455241 [Helianthus annuus]|nr:hypothetical protein HanPSC8_Chr11g0455241 [Helianthus annuus]